MRDSHSVITHAVDGHTKELAAEFEVSLPRMYQLLGDDCTYKKTKRLIRAIAHVNPSGARLIKADMDALWCDILAEIPDDVTAADLHREAFEAVQAAMLGKPRAEQQRELEELIAVAEMMLAGLTVDRPSDLRDWAKSKVGARN